MVTVLGLATISLDKKEQLALHQVTLIDMNRLWKRLPVGVLLVLGLVFSACTEEAERKTSEPTEEEVEDSPGEQKITTSSTAATTTTSIAPTNSSQLAPARVPREAKPQFGVGETLQFEKRSKTVTVANDAELSKELAGAQDLEIVLAPGVYAPFEISGANKVTIVGGEGVTITDNRYNPKDGIKITSSDDVIISGVEIHKCLRGIYVIDSTNVELLNSYVHDIGQEAIHIQGRSRHIVIANNVAENTGNREGDYEDNGEIVYIGDGKQAATLTPQESPSQVYILNNRLTDATAEAIEIKAPVVFAIIEGNEIRRIRTATSGAVVVGVDAKDRPSSWGSDVRILRNLISEVTTSTQWRDANAIRVFAGATIIGNIIFDVDHRPIFVEGDLLGDLVLVEGNYTTLGRLGMFGTDQRADGEKVDIDIESVAVTAVLGENFSLAELASNLQSGDPLSPEQVEQITAALEGVSATNDGQDGEQSFGLLQLGKLQAAPVGSDGKPLLVMEIGSLVMASSETVQSAS